MVPVIWHAALAAADADAKAAGLNRSELIEKALRNELLRNSLDEYHNRTVPALKIGAYADQVYRANRSVEL
jgi:metal-responsive CopG/Arc/MetJ family transcriptional regulator